MTIVLFLLYLAAGAGVGYGIFTFTAVGLPLSIAGGAITSAMLGQVHILARSGAATKKTEARLDAIEKVVTEVSRTNKVIEARTDALEETVKHELGEERDRLIKEMKHLEKMIERLALSMENRQADVAIPRQNSTLEDALLRDVREALQAGRVDLHLQPIVSLPQRRVSFYEGFTRLRRVDGSLILPADFLDAARRANLMGAMDNFLMFRCVQIVRRLAERDRRVFAALRERGIPVAVSMAGGYGHDIDSTVAVHRRTLQEALDSWHLWAEASAAGTMEQSAF